MFTRVFIIGLQAIFTGKYITPGKNLISISYQDNNPILVGFMASFDQINVKIVEIVNIDGLIHNQKKEILALAMSLKNENLILSKRAMS